MKPDAYERTLKARAFDVARYLLPLATNTSLGQIVNARTLETQVSRLLSHPAAEIRDLGNKLAKPPPVRPGICKPKPMPDCKRKSLPSARISPRIRAAPDPPRPRQRWSNTPSLILTEANPAPSSQAATEILADTPIASAPVVDLVERTESLEVELAATLLYSVPATIPTARFGTCRGSA
jgi:hypothetical protein